MTVKEFSNRIGLKDPCTIYSKSGLKRFQKYITVIEGEQSFISEDNYTAYIKTEELKFEVTARCGLFTEFLNKEMNITYTDIGKFVSKYTGIPKGSLLQQVSSLRFGYDMALAIVSTYKKYDNEKIKLFDRYYGWSSR